MGKGHALPSRSPIPPGSAPWGNDVTGLAGTQEPLPVANTKQNWKAQDSCEGVHSRVALGGLPTERVCKHQGLVLSLYLAWIWAHVLGLFLSVPLNTHFVHVD